MIRAEVSLSANRELVPFENKPAPPRILFDTSNPLIPSGKIISFPEPTNETRPAGHPALMLDLPAGLTFRSLNAISSGPSKTFTLTP